MEASGQLHPLSLYLPGNSPVVLMVRRVGAFQSQSELYGEEENIL
jgi:hypothetical protein